MEEEAEVREAVVPHHGHARAAAAAAAAAARGRYPGGGPGRVGVRVLAACGGADGEPDGAEASVAAQGPRQVGPRRRRPGGTLEDREGAKRTRSMAKTVCRFTSKNNNKTTAR